MEFVFLLGVLACSFTANSWSFLNATSVLFFQQNQKDWRPLRPPQRWSSASLICEVNQGPRGPDLLPWTSMDTLLPNMVNTCFSHT